MNMENLMFSIQVKRKYAIAIITKEDFKKNPIKDNFYNTFSKNLYKRIIPKLTSLFRKLNKGVLKKTVIVDFGGNPQTLHPIDLQLIEALKSYGYEVNEDIYKTGVALKEGKQVNILDILKTKATKARAYDKLKSEYDKNKNDRVKKEIEFIDSIISMKLLDSTQKIDIKKLSIYDNNKSKIVFSYDHRAIASQSTNVGWTSCMNLRGGYGGDRDKAGSEYEKVGSGASSGCFIAYLVKNGDEYTLNSPTARVLFKPFFGKKTRDIIWRADKIYGSAGEGFRKKAQELVDAVLDYKPDAYVMTDNTYIEPDGGLNRIYIHDKYIYTALKDKNIGIRRAAIENPNATIKHIDKALNDDDKYVRRTAIKHPNATEQHIDKALIDKDEYVRKAAIKNPKATEQHIDKALDDKDDDVRKAAIENPNATIKHIDKALSDKDKDVRTAAIQQKKRFKKIKG